MNELRDFSDRMREDLPAEYTSLPDIDLYMDQVLAFLSRRRVSGREGDDLTSAMVNNYIKDNLVPRANGKKYTREHLVYLSLISRLKQVLSVKDMAVLLRADMPAEGHEAYYEHFRSLLSEAFDRVAEAQGGAGQSLSAAALELALTSYANKVASEYLIDRLAEQQTAAKEALAAAQKAEKESKKAEPKPQKSKT